MHGSTALQSHRYEGSWRPLAHLVTPRVAALAMATATVTKDSENRPMKASFLPRRIFTFHNNTTGIIMTGYTVAKHQRCVPNRGARVYFLLKKSDNTSRTQFT